MKHPKVIHTEFVIAGLRNLPVRPPNQGNTYYGIGSAVNGHRERAVDCGQDYWLPDGGGPESWTDLYDGDKWDEKSYGKPYARITLTRDGDKVEPL